MLKHYRQKKRELVFSVTVCLREREFPGISTNPTLLQQTNGGESQYLEKKKS